MAKDPVLTPEEEEELRMLVLMLTDNAVVEVLERLANRELQLLRDEAFGNDKDMRTITLANVSALIAAAERIGSSLELSLAQREKPGTGTSEDPPLDSRVRESKPPRRD